MKKLLILLIPITLYATTKLYGPFVDTAITASRALVTDSSSQLTNSTTTSTELGYVSGVTSAIQTQINTKQATLTAGQLAGTATNDNAATGKIGEYILSTVTQGSAVTLTTATTKTVASESLSAGDWDVSGIACLNGGLTGTQFTAAIGQTTNNLTGTVLGDSQIQTSGLSTATADDCQTLPSVRQSLSGTTAVYLLVNTTFTIGTGKAYGRISARRVR